LTTHENMGTIVRREREGPGVAVVRLLLPAGWLLAAVGYYGAWISHPTSALTLSGGDMAEFVKFLPGVLDGSLRVHRQLFYLPPGAVVAGVALLAGARRLSYPLLLRLLAVGLAVPLSLQLLPPAWSPASLVTAEFRWQVLGLGVCWFLLAGFWLWGRAPARLVGGLTSLLALAAGGLSVWQFLTVKPAIAVVYGRSPAMGWGLVVSLAGLAIMAGSGAVLASAQPPQRKRPAQFAGTGYSAGVRSGRS